MLVALLIAAVSPTPPAQVGAAADLQWTVVPGRTIGSVRIGMSPGEIVQTVGRPTSRATDHVWTYETPFKGRVEFHGGRVFRIMTWDPRAATGDGLRVGSGRTFALQWLGPNPQTYPMPAGTWFHDLALGLAVYVERDIVRELAVMPPGPGTALRPSPGGPPMPRALRTRRAQTGGPSPGLGPQIVIEQLVHRVGSTVTVSGVLKNTGTITRLYVALVVSAKAFRGDPPEDRRIVATTSLEPGARQPFSLDLGKDLWESYAVRVDSYSPRQTGEALASASGFISRRTYDNWLGEDFRRSAHVSTTVLESSLSGPAGKNSVGKLRVTGSVSLPRYARAAAIAVRVRWELRGRPGASPSSLGSGERHVVLRPEAWDAEIVVSHAETLTINVVDVTVIRVDWSLNF
jgi:hypothetical protein